MPGGADPWPAGPGPIRFGPNQPTGRPYRGGAGIARLRGLSENDDSPEDFVASTTEIASGGGVGLSRLPDGTLLLDAVADDPLFYLGAEHVATFGASTELLVKLLDTGERLFVHFHPDDEFATEELGRPHGKTEAWIVTDVRGMGDEPAEGVAYVGWNREVSRDEVDAWVDSQDIDGMLAAMVRVAVRPGSVLFVPAGVPHSIGAGITLVELQQPSDLSILLEYRGFPIAPSDLYLGLDRWRALDALDLRATPPRHGSTPSAATAASAPESMFGPEADPYFRAERIRDDAPVTLDAGFSILVVLEGTGELRWSGGVAVLTRGDTVLLPHALGEALIEGVSAIRCRPPAASAVHSP